MSTDKLGLFNSVWPSDAFNLPWGNQTLHSWQETVFHDFASVYFGRGICQSPVVILEFQASYLPWECENPQVNLTLEFSLGGSMQWLNVCLRHKACIWEHRSRYAIRQKIAWNHWFWIWIRPLTFLETDSHQYDEFSEFSTWSLSIEFQTDEWCLYTWIPFGVQLNKH